MSETTETYVRFIKDFDWHVPGAGVIKAYSAGFEGRVTRECAAAAKAAGAATVVKPKSRRSV